MRAMVLSKISDLHQTAVPLEAVELPLPVPVEGQVRLKVLTCGVCHTELDEIEGRTPPPHLPVIPGHQVVGVVDECGPGAVHYQPGQRVGVTWFYSSCGECEFCRNGQENLCSQFCATGRDVNGGYAEYMLAPESSCFALPAIFRDAEAAPLLCAGAVGYRSLQLTGLRDGQTLGLTGFGASAHLVLQIARKRYPDSPVFVFARSEAERGFARQLGADWAGGFGNEPPRPVHAMIDTTPAWQPVLAALEHLSPGGRLVINAIRKESGDQDALLRLDYAHHLWLEKEIKSVANITRRDVEEFLALAAEVPLKPEVQVYPLEQANQALLELKQRKIRGAKVLQIGAPS
jgi:alcohol dehydrogenase, propanol-preferring